MAAGSLKALELARRGEQRARLWDNTAYFRAQLEECGFDVLPGERPINPIMLYDARKASDFAAASRAAGIYVTAFSFPVVPRGQARIRTQMSSALGRSDIDRAVEVFRTFASRGPVNSRGLRAAAALVRARSRSPSHNPHRRGALRR